MARNAVAVLFVALFFTSVVLVKTVKGDDQVCIGSCWVIWNCRAACHRFGYPKGGNCYHNGTIFKCCCYT